MADHYVIDLCTIPGEIHNVRHPATCSCAIRERGRGNCYSYNCTTHDIPMHLAHLLCHYLSFDLLEINSN